MDNCIPIDIFHILIALWFYALANELATTCSAIL